jgi:hypothetical protein
LLELLKNEFPWIPENRTHGGGVCYTVRVTDITRSRTQAELKQSQFELVLVQEPTDQGRVQLDEAVSDTQRNACTTSYVTTDNSGLVACIILKVICK